MLTAPYNHIQKRFRNVTIKLVWKVQKLCRSKDSNWRFGRSNYHEKQEVTQMQVQNDKYSLSAMDASEVKGELLI